MKHALEFNLYIYVGNLSHTHGQHETLILEQSFPQHYIINTPITDEQTKRGGVTIILSKEICTKVTSTQSLSGAGTEGTRATSATFIHKKHKKL